ncbi:hypothetical protein [Acetobacterium sp.]|uniref:hypothetical protein n=1 Tax=Acetobacterium sp. TaxID=1872094 RepID=UPI0035945194
MLTELNVKIIKNGDHLEILEDGLMVAKREAIKDILNNGEVEEFYDNWIYPSDPNAPKKLGNVILGLINGDFGKVE